MEYKAIEYTVRLWNLVLFLVVVLWWLIGNVRIQCSIEAYLSDQRCRRGGKAGWGWWETWLKRWGWSPAWRLRPSPLGPPPATATVHQRWSPGPVQDITHETVITRTGSKCIRNKTFLSGSQTKPNEKIFWNCRCNRLGKGNMQIKYLKSLTTTYNLGLWMV